MNQPENDRSNDGAAPELPGDAAATVKSRPGKAIILFSDGTGNSSAKLFKTNVWRMYEAVDLGATAVDAKQIVYYDEGVGNSGFRPLAVLGAVFGVGLKRNILDLYSFLCRNYRPGDEIYVFGFSRGAFTVRMLVGLIATQGVVDYVDDRDLARQARDAYRHYIRSLVPRFPPMLWLLPAWRAFVRLLLSWKRRLLGQRRYDESKNHKPTVRFVGVWDTVAAYGGPIIELVRAFDDWVRPLSFKDQRLSDRVEMGRHALALDDERDAFQPVTWDEPFPTDRQRIKQVWFAGMHADVGGGYPDDSLAYVSLAWMMEEAQAAGLKLREEKVKETNRIANAFGPIHDSRAGVGAYYRYQPRVIGGYVKPPEPGTESMEDPEFDDQGLNHRVWIHDSVMYRVRAGVDGYAPITLPRDLTIVDHNPGDSRFPRAHADNLSRTAEPRAERAENLRDLVWKKRIYYFAIVGLSLALASMPLWPSDAEDFACADSRCVLGTAFGWLEHVLPGLAKPWVHAFADQPDWTLAFIIGIAVFLKLGRGSERKLRDGARGLWREALAGEVEPAAGRPFIRRLRTHPWYQGTLEALKWHVLPFFLGLLMIAILAWGAATAATQLRLAWSEPRGMFCRGSGAGGLNFRTDAVCNPIPLVVERKQTYEVKFYLKGQWSDGGALATPEGLPAGAHRFGTGYVGAPFRRVIQARYLQPLVAIHPKGRLKDVRLKTLELKPHSNGIWSGEFTADASGPIAFAANEAVPPWPFDKATFYRGSERTKNGGAACVAIARKVGTSVQPIITCDATCAVAAGQCSWHFADPKLEAARLKARSRPQTITGAGGR